MSPRRRPVKPAAPTSSRRCCAAGRSSPVGKARGIAAARVSSLSKTFHCVPVRSVSPQGCCSHAARCEHRSSRNSICQASTDSAVRAATQRERVERAGTRSRPKMARKTTAHGRRCWENASTGRSTAQSTATASSEYVDHLSAHTDAEQRALARGSSPGRRGAERSSPPLHTTTALRAGTVMWFA